jgi:hypothetical protein
VRAKLSPAPISACEFEPPVLCREGPSAGLQPPSVRSKRPLLARKLAHLGGHISLSLSLSLSLLADDWTASLRFTWIQRCPGVFCFHRASSLLCSTRNPSALPNCCRTGHLQGFAQGVPQIAHHFTNCFRGLLPNATVAPGTVAHPPMISCSAHFASMFPML